MKNIHKLDELCILGIVRQRLGVERGDNSKDSEIDKMSSDEIIKEWSTWHLGCSSWWVTMKGMFDKLEAGE